MKILAIGVHLALIGLSLSKVAFTDADDVDLMINYGSVIVNTILILCWILFRKKRRAETETKSGE